MRLAMRLAMRLDEQERTDGCVLPDIRLDGTEQIVAVFDHFRFFSAEWTPLSFGSSVEPQQNGGVLRGKSGTRLRHLLPYETRIRVRTPILEVTRTAAETRRVLCDGTTLIRALVLMEEVVHERRARVCAPRRLEQTRFGRGRRRESGRHIAARAIDTTALAHRQTDQKRVQLSDGGQARRGRAQLRLQNGAVPTQRVVRAARCEHWRRRAHCDV